MKCKTSSYRNMTKLEMSLIKMSWIENLNKAEIWLKLLLEKEWNVFRIDDGM